MENGFGIVMHIPCLSYAMLRPIKIDLKIPKDVTKGLLVKITLSSSEHCHQPTESRSQINNTFCTLLPNIRHHSILHK